MSRAGIAGFAALLALTLSAASGRASTPTTRPIVFAADRTPSLTGEIYRLDPNGRRVDLSKSPYRDTYPAVSPDGKQVAFASDRSGASSVYVVGIDGRRLARIGPSFSLEGQFPTLAWQPGGNRLALAGATGVAGVKTTLWILRRGSRPLKLLSSKNGVQGVSWSPDGRVLTASPSLGVVRAFDPAGRLLWRTSGGCCGVWSPQGLLAVATIHGAGVYDETGRLRFAFALPKRAANLSWSPDGRYLAVNWSDNKYNWLEVLTATGAREFRRHIPLGNLAWAGSSTVVVGYPLCPACGKTAGFDVPTGKQSPASNRWLGPLSPDGKLAIVTPARKPGYVIGVARPGGGPTTTYARIAGCIGPGFRLPAASSLQFVGRSRRLVYQSWNDCDEPFSNLYSVAPDGGTVRQLTNVQAQETQPALSPDGTEIAYVWARYTGLTCAGCSDGIRVASADGTALRTLTNPENCTFDDSPTWSPDGSTILFSETGCDSPGELYTVAAAGGPVRDLHVAGVDPAWGPSRIAYVQGFGPRDSGPIWTTQPDGSDRVEVAAHGTLPTWSPDGRLAYLLGAHDTTVAVGSTQAQLPFASVTSLAWSPDGTRLVVTASRTKAGPFDLYTVNPDGTDPVALTKDFGALGPQGG